MENGRIRGIIFDLDGVLVSTDRLHFLAWKRIADRLGCPFDERLNDSLRGVSRTESLGIILRAGGVTLTEGELYALAEEKNPAKKRRLLAGFLCYGGLAVLLAAPQLLTWRSLVCR